MRHSKGDSLGDTRNSPSSVTQDVSHPPSNELFDIYATLPAGKRRLMKASGTRQGLDEAGHPGTLCLHRSKSQT